MASFIGLKVSFNAVAKFKVSHAKLKTNKLDCSSFGTVKLKFLAVVDILGYHHFNQRVTHTLLLITVAASWVDYCLLYTRSHARDTYISCLVL